MVGKQFTTRFDVNQTACQRTRLRRGKRRGRHREAVPEEGPESAKALRCWARCAGSLRVANGRELKDRRL